jgi:hypothetical protein
MNKENPLKIQIDGTLTAGYYNDMEAGNPVFIDGISVSDKIKDTLDSLGLDSNFCYSPFETAADVKNPLINKRIRMIIEIFD